MLCRGEYKSLERTALEQGWTVTKTNKNHIRFRSPQGSCVFVPSTPSDWRGPLKARSDLRRAGLKI
jgi:predicted RNA binding protein YcfA (HicA-like mRNA interferase family)